jgi:hypothetical protein
MTAEDPKGHELDEDFCSDPNCEECLANNCSESDLEDFVKSLSASTVTVTFGKDPAS